MRTVLCALVLCVPGAGQEDFRATYQRAEELRAGGVASAEAIQAAYRAALEEFHRMPAARRADPSWLPSGAFCAWQAGLWSTAAELFAGSMKAGNRDAFNAGFLLRSQLEAGQHDALLRSARELAPVFGDEVDRVLIEEGAMQRARAWIVGDAWLRSGDTEAGLWVFRTLARAVGEHPDALANLALALRHAGLEQESEATYRRALSKTPDDASLWNDLGLLFKGAGRFDEAEQALRRSRSLEISPKTGAATTNLAVLALRTGQRGLSRPARALAVVLTERPDAGLARRAYLTTLTRTRFPTSIPDMGGRRR